MQHSVYFHLELSIRPDRIQRVGKGTAEFLLFRPGDGSQELFEFRAFSITINHHSVYQSTPWVCKSFVEKQTNMQTNLNSKQLVGKTKKHQKILQVYPWGLIFLFKELHIFVLKLVTVDKISHRQVINTLNIIFKGCTGYTYIFFCLFVFSRAAATAYGGSQVRGLTGVVATGLHHSHSNMESELCLRPTAQPTATPDP